MPGTEECISVAVSVAVSLNHRYCDNLCEIQQKIAKWNGALCFFPLG
jgi:hypothetical protein